MYQNIPTKIRTKEVRISYEHLNEPYASPNQVNAEPKYSATLLIPKSDTVTKQEIDAAMTYAYEKAVRDDWRGARPQLKNRLIYDGDGLRNDGSKFGPECAGHWVITASSKRKPDVVHYSNLRVQLEPRDVYSGMYAEVTLNFYAFNVNGNRGIGCGLNNVMKTRDGEPLAGGASAASDFEDVDASAYAAKYGAYQQAEPAYAQPAQGYYQPRMSGAGAAAPGQQPAADPYGGMFGAFEELPFS